MMRQWFFAGLLLGGGPLLSACLAAEAAGNSSGYLREDIYDAAVHADEALVNVRVANSRWPDCTTLESAIADIFRLEGATNKPDQDKALALWKWFRILVSATGGSYAYEGPRGKETVCADPHKIFTVYGHHQCDGQSWAMVALWRTAGYMALDECNLGHTTASLPYRDADGNLRYHSYDPQRRYYHWDDQNQRVATRSIPVIRGMVYRHLTAPRAAQPADFLARGEGLAGNGKTRATWSPAAKTSLPPPRRITTPTRPARPTAFTRQWARKPRFSCPRSAPRPSPAACTKARGRWPARRPTTARPRPPAERPARRPSSSTGSRRPMSWPTQAAKPRSIKPSRPISAACFIPPTGALGRRCIRRKRAGKSMSLSTWARRPAQGSA